MNNNDIIEPLEFAFTNEIFKGLSEATSKNFITVNKLEDAYKYAFEQNLPTDYKIWGDVIGQHRKLLRQKEKFQEAYDFINSQLDIFQNENTAAHIEFRKKKVRKTNTAYDDFIFSEAREDALFVLSTVAISRYLDNSIKDSFPEEIYRIYKAGGWPCGMKGDLILVFDPSSLD